jgi:hypothetical protein
MPATPHPDCELKANAAAERKASGDCPDEFEVGVIVHTTKDAGSPLIKLLDDRPRPEDIGPRASAAPVNSLAGIGIRIAACGMPMTAEALSALHTTLHN